MLVLGEEAIERLHAPIELIEAVFQGFVGAYQQPARQHLGLGTEEADGTLLVMPAWRDGKSIGLKAVTVMPRNAERGRPTVNGVYLLLWPDGAPRAVLDAKALTLARTAAVSAVAARLLSRPEARTLLMVGTGALAPHLIRAHAAVRDYDRVLVWGRAAAKAQALAQRMAAEGLPASPAADLAAAVRAADVISCATLTHQPLVRGVDLKPGAHLDLVGSFTPSMRETDDEAVRRASVFTDTMTALDETGDLTGPLAAGALEAASVVELSALARAGARPRTDGEITLFKAVGTAIADLAAAEHFVGRIGHN